MKIKPFQVGIDKVSFSSLAFSTSSSSDGFPERLHVLPETGFFRLKGVYNRRPGERFCWTRRAEYFHEPEGHRLILFLYPSRLFVPEAFLRLIPSEGRLLSPKIVRHLLAPFSRFFRLRLKVSEVELAADFDVDSMGFERMGRVMWVPKAPWPKRKGEYDPTFYWGERRSGCQTKLYMKYESGQSFARLEHTFRRSALRRMRVHRPTDLLYVDWARVASRQGQFVEFDIVRPTRRPRFLVIHLRAFIRSIGLKPVLRPKGPRYQRWIKSRFVPHPVQRNLEAALATLSATTATSHEREGRFEI